MPAAASVMHSIAAGQAHLFLKWPEVFDQVETHHVSLDCAVL